LAKTPHADGNFRRPAAVRAAPARHDVIPRTLVAIAEKKKAAWLGTLSSAAIFTV
jgi:hypothetical protein